MYTEEIKILIANFVEVSPDVDWNYRYDWTDLMPVIEKIESIDKGTYGISTDPWSMEIIEYASGKEESVVKIERYDGESKKEMYYQLAIEFITWYNNKKK